MHPVCMRPEYRRDVPRTGSAHGARLELACLPGNGWAVRGDGFRVHVDAEGVLRSPQRTPEKTHDGRLDGRRDRSGGR